MAIEVFFRPGWLEVGRGSETEVQFGNEVIGLEAYVRGNPFAHWKHPHSWLSFWSGGRGRTSQGLF